MSHIIDPLREAVEVVWKVIDSVSVHDKRMQANGGVNSCKSKPPDNKTQEGSLKTGGSSKILTLRTESHRYTDKQTHTLPTTTDFIFSPSLFFIFLRKDLFTVF